MLMNGPFPTRQFSRLAAAGACALGLAMCAAQASAAEDRFHARAARARHGDSGRDD